MSRPSAALRCGSPAVISGASPALELPRVRRVAVFRALQLGDLLCAVPAFRALRGALPRAEIVLVGLPWARSFASRFKRYLDAFLEFPGYPGLPERTPDLDRFPRFLEEARRHRFDLVVQMHGSGELTNPAAALLGGRTTAGFYRPGHYCPEPGRFLEYPDTEPEVRRLLHLAQFLGAAPRGEFLEFPLTEEDREDAARTMALSLRGASYACVHPGARAAERRWPPEAFARVADAIARRGVRVVVTGSAEEAPLTHAVVRAMREPAIDAAGRTSLGALAALVSRARVVVCNDTGLSHLADALGVASVVVYSGSDPQRWAPLDRAKHRVIDARSASFSARRTSSDDSHVDRVIAEVADLLRAEGLYAA